ncbi:MAG TPA: DUF3817 domain-containing protein [Candidatus Saccharimonadales bacterium]|nr:DUF3817 domain-containing protein [Candidatus Saccharimonadales bacterium]
MIERIFTQYKYFRPFTREEAFMLFNIAAIAEAIGWTLLITGIIISKYITPGNDIAVQLAGHVHGVLFLFYVTAVIMLSPSLNFSFRRQVVAAACSVPPFGTLIFELWYSNDRRMREVTNIQSLLTYKQLLELTS